MNSKSSLLQAAIVLKSLPKKQVAGILSRLEAADIQSVLDAINTLDTVSVSDIEESATNLGRQSRRLATIAPGGAGVSNSNAVDDETAESNVPKNHPFVFLVEAPAVIRDRIILDEHPRNIALILSTLPPETSSECMQVLEPELRFSVLKRLCELDEVRFEDLMELSYTLKLRCKKMLNRKAKNAGVCSAAEVLSCSDPRTQQTLLAYMSSSDPELADELQRSVLTMEHLADLDDDEIHVLLRNVDTSCWAPALKKSSLAVTQKIIGNMAPTPAEMLTLEMASIGDVDEYLAQAASKQIINAAVQLNREGAIKLSKVQPGDPQDSLFPSVGPTVHFPTVTPSTN